jgi:integrase
MPTIRLNASTVAALKPRDVSYITYDAVARGFGVRTTPAGAKSYVLTYRLKDGHQRRMTVGRVDQMLVIDARKEAQALLLRIGQGEDPLAELEAEISAPTMVQLWDRYVAEHMIPNKRPRSRVEDRTMWTKYIGPEMGSKKVEDVTVEDVTKLFNRVKRSGLKRRPAAVIQLLSTMLSLAVAWKMRGDNPCKHVRRPRGEHRNRYLSDAEQKRLLVAVSHLDDREAAAAILLLLLTGARMNELLQSTWEQFDLDDDGIWVKPASNTKQKRVHRIPLNARAISMLKQLRRYAEPGEELVFPTRARIGNVRMAWQQVRREARIPDVRIHDLRHSYASRLINQNVTLYEVGALLGHSDVATTSRYAHLTDATLRRATEKAGKSLPAHALTYRGK